jgi:hypothetical protein
MGWGPFLGFFVFLIPLASFASNSSVSKRNQSCVGLLMATEVIHYGEESEEEEGGYGSVVIIKNEEPPKEERRQDDEQIPYEMPALQIVPVETPESEKPLVPGIDFPLDAPIEKPVDEPKRKPDYLN